MPLSSPAPSQILQAESTAVPRRLDRKLLLASASALFFELLIIRYFPTEVRAFTNLKNLPLIASFFGLGLGMMSGLAGTQTRRIFPFTILALILPIRFASWLALNSQDVLWNYSLKTGNKAGYEFLHTAGFLALLLYFTGLIVLIFRVLGGIVGQYLKQAPPLAGYGLNLAGSLLGVVLFSALGYFNSSPRVWLLVGFSLLVPFFIRHRATIACFALCLLAVALPEANTLWSPYYKIKLVQLASPAGWQRPTAYSVVTNHVWYQWAADLSPAFLEKFPKAEPNHRLVAYYDLPYKLVPEARRVLILGAGTGNDVAGALRHGAEHIDAVEIDPVILKIGRQKHPEHPYDSPRVAVNVTDARAFLESSRSKYDLIVFAFLDSTTLLSSFSSVRLDNYVYTLESFQSAKNLLAPDGTLVVSFATGRNFATDRLFATLERAFDGTAPSAYFTNYWVTGVLLVEGKARGRKIAELSEATEALQGQVNQTRIATDDWPFLYLESAEVPGSVLMVSGLFILMCWLLLRAAGAKNWTSESSYLHFFVLGAGFLLLETKAVTSLALLFGSTWIVNSLVIASFLCMAVLSNFIVWTYSVPNRLCYTALLTLLAADKWFPYSSLNTVAPPMRLIAGGMWVALPVLLSGIVFSSGVKRFGRLEQVLGVNLLGAVVGGVLENAVMIGGSAALGWLAFFIYVISAVCLIRSQHTGKAPRFADTPPGFAQDSG
jgi:spermidine synthase